MKLSEFRKLIREEIRNTLNEAGRGPTQKDVQLKVLRAMEKWLEENIEKETGMTLVDATKDENNGEIILKFKDDRTSSYSYDMSYNVTIDIKSKLGFYTPEK